jgi:nitrous oxide reductase accessory protein NosL
MLYLSKRRRMVMRRIALFGIVFVFLFVAAGTAMAADKCPMCGMNLSGNENTAFVVTMKTGEDVTYCCAHCGLWVMAKEADKVKSAKTRDFINGEWVDASKAVYLFKSKAVPACAPSWIAFGSKKDAERFKKGFGGTIYAYEKALKVRASQPEAMEMPKQDMKKEMEH